MKERMNAWKKKRVCSEWRKACSRVAARDRRERECRLFAELLSGLPLPRPMVAHLDKASVIRLTLGYLRLRALMDVPDCAANPPHRAALQGTRPVTPQSDIDVLGYKFDGTSCVEMVLDSALEGFLVLLSRDGQVIYTTEAISMHTGIQQVDLIGQCLYDFMHPCDQQEAREILSSKSGVEECQKCDLFFRMRCTLTPQRGNINLKSNNWKVMHCTGVRKRSVPAGSGGVVLLCQSLPVPLSGAYGTNLNSAFLSKHSPDMRFTYCQPRVFQLTGYTETDLLGHSVYQYYHASDCQHVRKAHLSLFSKGQTSTGKYRLLVKHGGYVWVETVATVVYNSRSGQLQGIICINYILSEVEQSGVMFSLEQMECLLMPFTSSPTPATPFLLPGDALLDKLSLKAAVPGDPSDSPVQSPGESTWTRDYEGYLSETPERDTFITCHDLETLAPYIPMDGEDFPLSPPSDMEEVEHKGQEFSHSFPLIFPNQEIQSHACPLSHLNHTWTHLTPPMSSPSLQSYCFPGSTNQAHTLMTEHGGDSRHGYRQRSGQGWWQPLKRHRGNMHLTTGPGTELHTVPPSLKKLKKADVSFSSNCTPCWWSPDGSVSHCVPVPWAPGHTDFPKDTINQLHPIRYPHRTVLLSCGSVLPVLSLWECEMNAPLDSSSRLLHGSEILSFLDQAMSLLPP